MPGTLLGRTSLVTGASAGIGLATARALAREGAPVVLVSEQAEALAAAAAAIRERGDAASTLVVDLSRPEEAAHCVARAEALAGPLDLIINNAGVGLQASLLEESMADVRHLFEINFFALVSICQQGLQAMAARGR